MPKAKHYKDPLALETFIMYDLQWIASDGATVHSVLHPISRGLSSIEDVLACGAIRQGGGRWIELKVEKLRNVTCLGCIARGGTTK